MPVETLVIRLAHGRVSKIVDDGNQKNLTKIAREARDATTQTKK